jgi:hypothetical protein
MTTTGVFLSRADLSNLAPNVQREIERLVFGSSAEATDQAGEAAAAALKVDKAEDEGIPTDLSVAQALKLYNGCSERPKVALRLIAEQPSNAFSYKALVAKIGNDSSGTIRGTLSAITRRTRTVLGDKDADFVWWSEDEAETWIGTVSPTTHASLRKALGIA